MNKKPINYLALDLELNHDNNQQVTKIIQVGIAYGSSKESIVTQKWYVNPQEPIAPSITALTGITQEDIDNKAVSLAEVANQLAQIIETNQTFVNPVQWGTGDATELLAEFRQNSILFPYFGNRTIDVKTLFVFLQMAKGNSWSGGLRSSMSKYKLNFKGDPHRADIDAYNTLVFYFELMERQAKIEEIVKSIKGVL
jgi:DNA polymerase III epsilon subunit-like protein